MGNQNLKQISLTMKVTLFVIAALCAFAHANQFSKCLTEIKAVAVSTAGPVIDTINGDILNAIKGYLRWGADGIDAGQTCSTVETEHFTEWLDMVLTAKQANCVQKTVEVIKSVQSATKEKNRMSTIEAVRSVETMLQFCLYPVQDTESAMSKL